MRGDCLPLAAQVKEKAKAAVQKLRDDFDAAQLRVQHLEAELQQRAAPAPEVSPEVLLQGRPLGGQRD